MLDAKLLNPRSLMQTETAYRAGLLPGLSRNGPQEEISLCPPVDPGEIFIISRKNFWENSFAFPSQVVHVHISGLAEI